MKNFLRSAFDRSVCLKDTLQENFRVYKALMEIPREEREMLPDGEIVSLTEGEANFARGIFGSEINTNIVRKILLLMESSRRAAAGVWGRRAIIFYGTENYSKDFTKEGDLWKVGVFAHELTHIWQNQTNMKYTAEDRSMRDYDYKLYLSVPFTAYHVEQQASIIKDYAQRFLMESAGPTGHSLNKRSENDIFLQRVVESRFPEAAKLRQAVEEQKIQRQALTL